MEEEDEGDAGVGRASDTLGVTVEEEERGGAEEEEGRVVGDLYSDVVLEEGASPGKNSQKVSSITILHCIFGNGPTFENF